MRLNLDRGFPRSITTHSIFSRRPGLGTPALRRAKRLREITGGAGVPVVTLKPPGSPHNISLLLELFDTASLSHPRSDPASCTFPTVPCTAIPM
jgi:hypothetical protein